MKRLFLTIATTTITVLLSVAITLAQGTCDEFLTRALEAVDTSCQDLTRNLACYGFDQVEASFLDDVEDDFFTQTSDTTEIASVETIRTAPFDIENDTWGVAVMVLQANMPETLPGQNVTFILMGDTEIENAVDPDSAFQPVQPVLAEVTFVQGAAVRSGPGDNFNTIGGVVTGHLFEADGISQDNAWLRVIWEGRPAWVRRSTINPTPEIDTLPTLSADQHTPMQAFYLRTGIGQPTCNEVPDNQMLVQGPEDIEIQLTVNGANIELGSSGILRVVEIDGQPLLEIIVLDGQFVVKADEFNPQDVVIRAGEVSRLCLDDGNDLGINGEADDLTVSCGASPPEQIPFEDFRDQFCNLETISSNLLNYGLSTCIQATHTVQAGENLFRISQFYCVDQQALADLNNITDPAQIFVGQVLVLPAGSCDGVGSTRPPAGVVQPTTNEVADTPTVNCDVSLISPLGDVNSGNHTFTWSGATGGDITYMLVFYNFEGRQVETFVTDGTSYTLNLGRQTSTGGQFSWEVWKLQSGDFVCASGRSSTLVRTGELNPPAVSNILVNVVCTTLTTIDFSGTVTWQNLPAGGTVTLSVTDGVSVTSNTFTTANGTASVSTIISSLSGPVKAVATTSTGENLQDNC